MLQKTLCKVLCWAVQLSIYENTYYHIKVDETVQADLQTR